MQAEWVPTARCDLICVDSYSDGVLQGWLHSLPHPSAEFLSLSQFLLLMEDRLTHASSNPALSPSEDLVSSSCLSGHKAGKLATFRLKVLFHQHTSWQGIVYWLEEGREANFRSVLELVMLLDRALTEKNQKIS